jgi:signal transduction histidine kinase
MWRSITSFGAAVRPLRLLYVGTAALILFLVAASVVVLLHLRERDLLHEEDGLRKLSLTLAEQADRSFQSVDLVLTSLIERLGASGVVDSATFAEKMSGVETHRLLRDKIDGIPQIAAVTLIGSEGDVINLSRYWPIPKISVADREYFKAVKADPSRKPYISVPVENRASGSWAIFMARRVNGPSGEFLGLIIGAMELRYFEDFYRAIAPGADSAIILLRQDGTTLVRYPPNDTVGKSVGGERVLAGGTSGTARAPAPADGQMTLEAAHRLANFPAIVLATKTEAAALDGWRTIAILRTVAVLGFALVLALFAFGLGRHWKHQDILVRAQADLRRQEDRTAAFEAMRVAKEAAEGANLAKSEFLTTMSHELRTPLNAILGFSDMMIAEMLGPLGNPRYRSYAKDIHDSGSHLLALINDILDLSKSVAGKLDLAENRVDARALVETACRLVQPRVSAARLTLTSTLPQDSVLMIGDARKLTQILLNLLSNAYKFTAPGGTIECSLAVDAAGIRFVVADDGIGIPADQLERVLQPFAQVDSSLSRRHEGTGLGLALVKAMAELHGGSLDLASAAGTGTTATVTIPIERLARADACDAP